MTQTITQEAQKLGLEAIDILYKTLNSDSGLDTAAVLDAYISDDFTSENAIHKDTREEFIIKFSKGFPALMTTYKYTLVEKIVSENRVTVRGFISATPAKGNFFGVEVDGVKSFAGMDCIDIHTINEQGKISNVYHMENWLVALGQLK